MATIPTNPSDGDTFTDGVGVTWTYQSSTNKWLIPLATASGGGGSSMLGSDVLSTSGTYTAVYTATYRFTLFGGGGSGWTSNTGGSLNIGGGGGGGAAQLTVALSAGDSFSYVIGAGASTAGQDVNGAAGGTSTATIAGTSLVANGGGGGVHSSGSGGAGGTATGGDTNYTGFAGHYANADAYGGFSPLITEPIAYTNDWSNFNRYNDFALIPIGNAAITDNTIGPGLDMTTNSGGGMYQKYATGGRAHTGIGSSTGGNGALFAYYFV
jgi:hypothetical protein